MRQSMMPVRYSAMNKNSTGNAPSSMMAAIMVTAATCNQNEKIEKQTTILVPDERKGKFISHISDCLFTLYALRCVYTFRGLSKSNIDTHPSALNVLSAIEMHSTRDLMILLYFPQSFDIASRANGENGCVRFAEIATQTVNLTNLLTNLEPNLTNCNMMSASFLDHISISALATSPPATSAIGWNNTGQTPHQPQQHSLNSDSPVTINNHNNNNSSTINNNNNNNHLNSINNAHTLMTSNNAPNSRRSSSDAITTNSHAIGWIASDAAVPRSNSCSSTSPHTPFNNTEVVDIATKCESNDDPCELETIPSIDDTSLPSPAHSSTGELGDEHTTSRINIAEGDGIDADDGTAGDVGAVDDDKMDADGNGDAGATSENAKTHSDGINGPANNSRL